MHIDGAWMLSGDNKGGKATAKGGEADALPRRGRGEAQEGANTHECRGGEATVLKVNTTTPKVNWTTPKVNWTILKVKSTVQQIVRRDPRGEQTVP